MGADVKSPRQGIDENLHAVLRAYRAGDGRDHGKQDRGMGERPPPHVASEKRKRAITVATSLFHFGRNSPVGCARATRFMQRKNRLWVPWEQASSTALAGIYGAGGSIDIDGKRIAPEGRMPALRSDAGFGVRAEFKPRGAAAAH